MGPFRPGVFLVGLFGFAVVACTDRPVGLDSDATPSPDAGLDAASPRDAGPDAVRCETDDWVAQEIAGLTDLYAIPTGTIEAGQHLRVVAEASFGDCHRFGGFSARRDETAREIQLTPWYLFEWAELCQGQGSAQETIVFRDLSPGAWRIWGSGREITVTVLPCAGDCACTDPAHVPGRYGDPCHYGCDCDAKLVCTAYVGVGGQPQSECYPPCSLDVDCAPGLSCEHYPDGPWGVCVPQFAGPVYVECDGDLDCGPDRTCLSYLDGSRHCGWTYTLADDYAPCRCDAQCGPGLECFAEFEEDWPKGECHRYCRGNRDCPGGWYCPALRSSHGPVCLPILE